MHQHFFKTRTFTLLFLSLSLFFASCGGTLISRSNPQAPAIAPDVELTVFRSPTCSCCGAWIDQMKAAGFRIRDEITEDIDTIKAEYGVADELASCHTTVTEDYVIEGHIPAQDVARLLMEQPAVVGIAVPGMPIGSPGMESGDYVEPYTVFSFTNDGTTTAFANHP